MGRRTAAVEARQFTQLCDGGPPSHSKLNDVAGTIEVIADVLGCIFHGSGLQQRELSSRSMIVIRETRVGLRAGRSGGGYGTS